jgi:NAD(P)-dependent dehydrogenase (short-subunit alcohol dehydrogenase family)
VPVQFRQGVTVVGGGGGALGSAVVSRLVAAGRQLVIPARHPDRVAPQEGVTVVACDLDDPDAVARLRPAVEALGPWEALVSASGGFAGGRAHETDDAAIEAMLGANLLAPWRLARTAAASMIAGGTGGRIVFVASRAAIEVARGQAAYQVSKTAVLRLSQVMAAELLSHSITVNSVLPGTIDTASNRAAMPKADRSTWVSADSVAAVIEWLLSEPAASVTGAAIPAG